MTAKKRPNHKLTALMRHVKAGGLDALDARSAAVRAVKAWRTALLNDLGGESNVSTQRMAIVDAVVRTKLFVEHLDTWLITQPSLVNKRRKAILPALRERQALIDSLARLLAQLGLERQERPVKSLHEYIREEKTEK